MATDESIRHIYISNISEDVWPFISAITNEKERQHEIAENALLSDRDLMANANQENTLIIIPQSVNPDFVNYYQQLFHVKNIQLISVKSHSGQICLDILKDKSLLNKLKKILANNYPITLESYSASIEFYALYDLLKTYNPKLKLIASPKEVDLWTVNFFGSKSGIRQLSQISNNKPEFKTTQGYIAVDVENAVKIASNINLFKKSVVIKTNKGHSGAGVLLFKPHQLPEDYYQCEKYLRSILSKDKYWYQFPIIIEDYINPLTKIGGGFPNVEYRILKNGQVKLLYFCSMRVTPQGVFKGVEINHLVLSQNLTSKMIDIGFYIGEQLSKFGYRGYYDVDYIVDKYKNLYVSETNVRRTGGTHVYHIAKALFGKHFMYTTYCLSNNMYCLPKNSKIDYQQLSSLLSPILFNPQTKEGLIIVSVGILNQNKFGYLIFAKNKQKAYELETKMEQLLVL